METPVFAVVYANTGSPSKTSALLASALQFPLLSGPRQFVDPLHVLILELHLETVLGRHQRDLLFSFFVTGHFEPRPELLHRHFEPGQHGRLALVQ